MKKKFSFFSGHRRWLSIVMIVSLILGMTPSTAFAETLYGSQLNPNPNFTVQYYGNIEVLDETGTGAQTSLSVINTDALGGLPQNGVAYKTTGPGDTDTKSVGNYLATAPKNSEKKIYLDENGLVMMTKKVTKIYKDKKYKYSSSPNLSSLDVVSQDGGHYALKEIWVLKNGKDAGSTNRNDWNIYSSAQLGNGLKNVRFTNTTASGTNQIQIKDGGVLRFVYDQNTGSIQNDTTMFDYDITDGKLYASDLKTTWTSGTKYVKSFKQGINSDSNYSGTGARLAFGNSNTTNVNDYALYDAYWMDGKVEQYLNRYNASWTSSGRRNLAGTTGKRASLGCTFELVNGIKNLTGDFVPVFNSLVTAPDLFSMKDKKSSSGKVKGKTTLTGYDLTFNRTGDTYVLTSVKNGNKGVDELHIFKDDYPDLFSNNFWPLDDAATVGKSGTDPLFGGATIPKYGTGSKDTFPPSDDRKNDHNSYFGMKYQVQFTLSKDYVGPLEYLFYGDDDMWVFLDSKLICDIGGVHSSVGEYVNLWDYVKADGKTHTLSVFYTERGASGSSCYTMFTLPSVLQSVQEVPYGSLKVEKDVTGTGAPADAEFDFQVNLTDKSGVQLTDIYPFQIKNNEDKVLNSGVITQGTGSFKLKDGQYVTIDYIPADAKYTVAETADAKYDTTITVNGTAKKAAGGNIAANATQNVKFTNKFKTGDLKVTKVLDGNATSPNDSFNFKVELSDKTITGTYGDMSFEKGVATFNLTGGTSKTAKDLPENVTYTVTETNSGKYALTGKTGDTGTIAYQQTQEAKFTNTYNTGSLKVSKTVTGNSGDRAKYFNFTVTLDDVTVNGEYGDMTFINGVATFALKDGESKTASGLKTGIGYTVTEEADGIHTTTKSGDTGTINTKLQEAEFINNHSTGSLKVTKTIVSNSTIDKSAEFTFTVTLSDKAINGTYGGMTFTEGVATFTLKHGESKTASGIEPGVAYTVAESNAGKYTVTSTGETGVIVGEETQTAAFTNTYNTGGLAVSKTISSNSPIDVNEAFHFVVTLSDNTVNGTYGEMTFTNGVAEFDLKHGETKTATDIHPGTSYTVIETNPGKYTVTSTGEAGTIVAKDVQKADFVNTYNTGALTVSKTVAGNSGDTEMDFEFRVVLSDTAVNGTYGKGESAIEFKNGVAEFTLKDGQSKTATDLHPGITYEVTELNPGLYKVTKTGDTGTITALETKEAAFINTYNTGGLTVKKFVAGNACDENKYFSFKVELSDTTINGPYGAGDSAMNFTNGVAEFSLKHGESRTATGLHPGITYTVTELDPGIYEVTKTGDTGVIEEVKVQEAVFTNTYDTGGLTVKKTVDGNSGDKEKPFSFKVELSDTSINGTYGDMTFVDGVATFTLKHGEMKNAAGLHPGTGYTVTELDPGVYTVTKTGETGTIQKVVSQIADFTNTYNTGGLEVSKTVGGNAGNRQKAFTFQVVLDDVTVNGQYGQMFFENGIATFALYHGESITATGLHPGTGYVVTELDPGIHNVTKTGDIGTIEEIVVKEAAFINTYNTGGLKITKTVNGNACNLEDTFPFKLELSDSSINGIYGDLEFTNGTAEFTLGHEQSVTVTGLHPGTAYTVTETDSGIYSVAAAGETGTIEPITIKEANFINSYNTGDLVVSKVVAGNSGDQDELFSFKVELSDTSVNGEYGEMTFINGESVFLLKHGESRTAEGLESGIEYTVSELNSGKYVVTSEGETGVITQGVPQAAVFTNTYDTGSLAVTKTVDGNAGDTEKDFDFTITLSDTTVNGEHGDMTFIDGVASFTLKHGETKTATDLDDGVTYTVTEEEDGIHTVTSVGETGTIVKLETSEAYFTNTYHTGRLTVSKTVGGSGGDTGKDFGFIVELDDTSISGEYGGMTFVNGVAEFTLAHGQSKTASDLPAGTMYTVTETNNAGYSVTSQGATGFIPENNGEATADFHNYRDPGAVNVTLSALKIYNGGTPDKKVFTFELKDADGNVLQTKNNDELGDILFDAIRYTEPGTHIYTITEVVERAGSVRFDDSVYTITVEVVQDGLDYGATVTIQKDGEPFSGTPVFKNYRTLPPVVAECSVIKVWADNDNAAGKRPESVSVQLMSGTAAVGSPVTLSEANGWSHTWTDLEEDVEYYVAEVNVPEGYTSVVTGSGESYTVINTYTELPPPPPEDPVIEPEDPKPPTGGKEPEDPVYDLDDGDIPQDYLEVGDPDIPKTSDESNVNMWMLIAMMSAFAMMMSLRAERKQNKPNV